ncbi:MAG TPA: DUF2127 domain-containing protein [Thermoleophilia bacterium]
MRPGLRTEKTQHVVGQAFDIGVLLKGLDGVLEILGGLFLLLVPLRDVRRFLIWVTGHELNQDPKDFIATHLVHLANTLSVSGYRLTIAYLLVHGFVKVFLVVMLLRRRLWAYPTAIAVFAAFGVYQVYQFSYSRSLLLLALTVLDVIVIVLTAWEYRILTGRARAADGETATSRR